ncbi:MAG: hypothetical protein R3248_00545 [Candidatus Promineifilaceae bacterium]|nr:hypothetical protein [Candidatus Promineifilaceae bacterium]
MNQLYSVAIFVTLFAGYIFTNNAQRDLNEAPLQASASNLVAYSDLAQQQPAGPGTEGDPDNDGGREIQATERISIPYGFTSTLPISIDGQGVQAIGHGGCTENEAVTVAVTVTQSTTGAVATGEWQGTCTGELQHWRVDATLVSGNAFEAGAAEVCGVATTRSDGEVTDTDEWCPEDGVTLIWRAYVPTILSRLES